MVPANEAMGFGFRGCDDINGKQNQDKKEDRPTVPINWKPSPGELSKVFNQYWLEQEEDFINVDSIIRHNYITLELCNVWPALQPQVFRG